MPAATSSSSASGSSKSSQPSSSPIGQSSMPSQSCSSGTHALPQASSVSPPIGQAATVPASHASAQQSPFAMQPGSQKQPNGATPPHESGAAQPQSSGHSLSSSSSEQTPSPHSDSPSGSASACRSGPIESTSCSTSSASR